MAGDTYVNLMDNPLKSLGKNVHMSKLPEIHYPDYWTSIRTPSQPNPEAKNVSLILLQYVLFTTRTLSFPLFFGTLWALPSCVFDLKILIPLDKPLPFGFTQSILILCSVDKDMAQSKVTLFLLVFFVLFQTWLRTNNEVIGYFSIYIPRMEYKTWILMVF